MTNLQETFYAPDVDYRTGSPHLSYFPLYDTLVGLLLGELDRLAQRGCSLEVLEVGAGHGNFTEALLAAGCDVTTVEISRHSADTIRRRFVHNPRLTSLHTSDGSLEPVRGKFGLITFISVLHHIPDYVAALEEALPRLASGGSVITLQDPLWYPRMPRAVHGADRVGYMTWRLRQGSWRRGLATRLRRLRGVWDESNPSDMVEYHVVRKGVDEEAVLNLLSPQFASVTLRRYWSNQSAVFQRLGSALDLENTFGVVASGYRS